MLQNGTDDVAIRKRAERKWYEAGDVNALIQPFIDRERATCIRANELPTIAQLKALLTQRVKT
jgi:hypothetical protein